MQPQLPSTQALAEPQSSSAETWFEYPVKVQPHHTDYSGVAWHGSYIAWMEEARVECLSSIGIEFADLVALGCDLPVVDLSLRYHRSVRMGMNIIVKTRMAGLNGVRIMWDYQIISADGKELYVTAQVSLAAVDRDRGKVMRRLPAMVQDMLAKLSSQF